MHRQVQVIRS